jgi:hypothetical protein
MAKGADDKTIVYLSHGWLRAAAAGSCGFADWVGGWKNAVDREQCDQIGWNSDILGKN